MGIDRAGPLRICASREERLATETTEQERKREKYTETAQRCDPSFPSVISVISVAESGAYLTETAMARGEMIP
jgi:hypothetical protein